MIQRSLVEVHKDWVAGEFISALDYFRLIGILESQPMHSRAFAVSKLHQGQGGTDDGE